MADETKAKNDGLLTDAERTSVNDEVRVTFMNEVMKPDSLAREDPTKYLANLRNRLTDQTLLDRADGMVVTDYEGMRSAKLGTLSVSEVKLFGNVDVSISEGVSPDRNTVIAKPNGMVLSDKGVGMDCLLSLQARMAVSEVLRDGKLDPQEADMLHSFIANIRKVKDKECGPTMET